MSPEAWQVILDAWDAIGQRIDRAFPSGRGDVVARRPPGDTSWLDQVRGELNVRFAELAYGLRGLGHADAEIHQVLEPLAIFLDERVLVRLPPAVGPSWSRLQTDLIGSDDGGVIFYERLDALLGAPHPSKLALQVYRFCLAEGFCGNLVDERPELQRYSDALATAILRDAPAARAAGHASALRPVPILRQTRAWVYYLIASAAAIALAVSIPLVVRSLLSS